jgi:trehalose 6-phosphate synthase/phosphatase
VEEKPVSLAWHYRNAEPEIARELIRELGPRLADQLREHDLEVIQGAKVLEVRPQGVHKGLVIPRVLAGAGDGAALIVIGDDRTDEDLFAAVPASALSIHVGSGQTRATFRLPDVSAVRQLLQGLLP